MDLSVLFTKQYFLLWAIALALALFWPVRQLIWVLYVRKAMGKGMEVDNTEQLRLKHRAGVTSALLCFIFSILYSYTLFND